jgi:hypothetical protein
MVLPLALQRRMTDMAMAKAAATAVAKVAAAAMAKVRVAAMAKAPSLPLSSEAFF